MHAAEYVLVGRKVAEEAGLSRAEGLAALSALRRSLSHTKKGRPCRVGLVVIVLSA